MSELDVRGLSDLHKNRMSASAGSQPRVQMAYWQGRIDEFIAQNCVSEKEQAEALAIAHTASYGPTVVHADGLRGLDVG